MPVARVSITEPACVVEAKIAALEGDGNRITSVAKVGDQYFIIYESRPRQGRPPKPMETRG